MSAAALPMPAPEPVRAVLEVRALLLVGLGAGVGVALAPAGAALVAAALGAGVAGEALLRGTRGRGLDASALRRLLAIAALAWVLNALFTSGPAWVVAGRAWPVSAEGARVGTETAIRVVALIVIFHGVVAAAPPLRVVAAVERGLAPLRRFGIPVEGVALIAMIALRVAPSFAAEARRLALQRALRRGWPGPGLPAIERRRRLALRLRDLPGVLVPLVLLGLRRAEELAWALPARYYGSGPRTPPDLEPWSRREWLAVGAAVALVALASWARSNA